MDKKVMIPIEILANDLPCEICKFLSYVRKLEWEGDIDYEYVNHLFWSAMETHGFKFDFSYDWADTLPESWLVHIISNVTQSKT